MTIQCWTPAKPNLNFGVISAKLLLPAVVSEEVSLLLRPFSSDTGQLYHHHKEKCLLNLLEQRGLTELLSCLKDSAGEYVGCGLLWHHRLTRLSLSWDSSCLFESKTYFGTAFIETLIAEGLWNMGKTEYNNGLWGLEPSSSLCEIFLKLLVFQCDESWNHKKKMFSE